MRRCNALISPFQVTTEGWNIDQLGTAFGRAVGGIAYLVPDFQNPTGALMDQATRQTVADIAARHGVTVVADEIVRYIDLRNGAAAEPRIQGAILLGSMSKTVWGGLRIGWLRGSTRLVRELLVGRPAGSYAPPPLEQLIACELFTHIDALVVQRRAELRSQRDHLAQLLENDDSWEFTLPSGGLSLWLHLTRTSGVALSQQAARHGLALTPGSQFSVDGSFVNWTRLPYTAPIETLDRVATSLKQSIHQR
ncbi:aminotransferase class I/II-fold pyridoxal phosphate-dependent enzyme [Catellatospora methionotrophica]|uniref:aminotransferase class I/II-fold pyridoxal phosphate-dependent enzyme n=1 Tax=Catellatospora methionotrophica TaxID=121620 RepID=UPI0033EA8F22